MKHDFRTCSEDDCDECQFLVDSGRLCSCDYCGEMLNKETHGHQIIDGLVYHNICIKYVMTPEKECYNQLLAIFLDYPEENREDFVSLLNHYESNFDFLAGVTYTGSRLAALHDKLNFSNEVKVAALKHLIKIFDIKAKYYTSYITGSYIVSG